MSRDDGPTEGEWASLDVENAASWDRALDALGPAAMLVAIDGRIGPALRSKLTAEDVWQDALLCAWRKRADLEWRGLPSFRRWLLEIAESCIWDEHDRALRLKRGGGREAAPFSTLQRADRSRNEPPVFGSTTPSRLAQAREQAQAMREALASLPDELRDVVRLRIFEERTSDEIATQLSIGVAAVKHRFRKGAVEYRRRLQMLLSTRGSGRRPEVRRPPSSTQG